MIFKLSWKSVRSQYYHYIVYLIGMVFAVTMYYSFSALTYDRTLLESIGQEVDLNTAMRTGSLLVILMILCFMLTINRFFFYRRAKEIGIYQLIGMRKRQLAGLLFSELYILGAAALVIGIGLGIIFSKLFSMILAKIMFLDVESVLSVSLPSIIETFGVFMWLLLFTAFHSIFLVYSYQLKTFFKTKQRPVFASPTVTPKQWILGGAGVCLIGFSYYLSFNVWSFITDSTMVVWVLLSPFVLVALCVVGTYLFFKYTLHVLLQRFASKEKHYYAGVSMLIVGNTRLHLFKGSRTLTAVAIFIACSLGIIGGAASFYTLGMEQVNASAPVDYIVSRSLLEDAQSNALAQGTDLDAVSLRFKLFNGQYRYSYAINNMQEMDYQGPINVLSLSNYQEFQQINPYLRDLPVLAEDEAVMMNQTQNTFSRFIRFDSRVQMSDGGSLNIVAQAPDYLGDTLLRYGKPTLVVADMRFTQIPSEAAYELSAFTLQQQGDVLLPEVILKDIAKEWEHPVYYFDDSSQQGAAGSVSFHPIQSPDGEAKEENEGATVVGEQEAWRLNYVSHLADFMRSRKTLGVFIYIVLFLGILALIITGSVLMVRQFAEAEREKANFELLRKLGIPEHQLRRLVYQQNIIVFVLPLLLGLFHAAFAIRLYSQLVPSSGYWLVYLCCGLLLLIYFVYYLLTSAIYCWITGDKQD